MRIEKINDKQIRCTLNKKDLSDRELRLSELAYGSDKAKALFRDMMQQASYEFGFEIEDIPLMIEAIPMYPDTLVLIITKVDDPDELDTRFSRFTEDPEGETMLDDTNDFMFDDDSDLLEAFELEQDDILPFDTDTIDPPETDFISLSEALGMEPRPKTPDRKPVSDVIKIYSFNTLDDITHLAESISNIYNGNNTLYKDEKSHIYYLVLHKSEHSAEEFNKICNIMSEYGSSIHNMYASHFYFEEHFEPLIPDKALQKLSSL